MNRFNATPRIALGSLPSDENFHQLRHSFPPTPLLTSPQQVRFTVNSVSAAEVNTIFNDYNSNSLANIPIAENFDRRDAAGTLQSQYQSWTLAAHERERSVMPLHNSRGQVAFDANGSTPEFSQNLLYYHPRPRVGLHQGMSHSFSNGLLLFQSIHQSACITDFSRDAVLNSFKTLPKNVSFLPASLTDYASRHTQESGEIVLRRQRSQQHIEYRPAFRRSICSGPHWRTQ